MSEERYKIIAISGGFVIHDTKFDRYAGPSKRWWQEPGLAAPFKKHSHDETALSFLDALKSEAKTASPKQLDPYKVRIGGVLADPYKVAACYELNDPMLFQALKKILRCGRKHKTIKQDVEEAITSLQRWVDIHGGEE